MSFSAPATSSGGVKPAELQGHLLIITPNEYKSSVPTSMGDSEAIAVDIVDLDTNEEHFDVLLFSIGLRSALKPLIGSQVLARIGQGVAKPGKSAPWILQDATVNPDDVAKATAYVTAKATGVWAAPAAPAQAAANVAAAGLVNPNDPAVAALIAQLQNK